MRIKESSKKTLYLVLGLLLLSICSLTIVYAALSAVLRISGNSEVVASNWDIHLENPVVKSGSVHNNLPTINGNSLSFNATLSLPGDYYEFDVDVANDGTIDAMIDSVSISPELTTDQAKYIKYEVSYQNGESISTKQTLKKGTSTPIRVRIEYRNDISASDLPSTETNLSLKVTLLYVQSDGTGSEIPNNGVAPKLINVVSGDIFTPESEICIGKECFYVINNDGSNVTMIAKYNLYVGGWYDYSSKVWAAYGEEATGIQDQLMVGAAPSLSSDRYGVLGFSDSTYWPAPSRFTIDIDITQSSLYPYIENYKLYLEEKGINIVNARLLNLNDFSIMGCSTSSLECDDPPSWFYSTAYWVGIAGSDTEIWNVFGGQYIGFSPYTINSSAGIRPVIEVPVSEF